MIEDDPLREVAFVPSRVEGLADVRRVWVFRDRLELDVGGKCQRFDFGEIAVSRESRWRIFLKGIFWLEPLPPLVADRDWFHRPSERFFEFYTRPRIKVFMPVDEVEDYMSSYFCRIQHVMRLGGCETFDLG